MKRKLLLYFCVLASHSLVAQTIVSTKEENKNVVLEEFTGILCSACPLGHAVAKGIQDENQNDVFVIKIHAYNLAVPANDDQPDFRTSFGNKLANPADVNYFPSGTINRHISPDLAIKEGKSGLDRSAWKSATEIILGQTSYVNIGVDAEINEKTRELTIHVEAYYTGNSPLSTNKLNVALLQNNTKGFQIGPYGGNEYVHMRRLIHMITGLWGEDVTTTTKGSFIDKTYTYTIPADYNGVPAILKDLEVVAFIAEGKQEIITGTNTFPSLSGNTTTSVNEIVNDGLSLNIFPNPVNDVLNVGFELEKLTSVKVHIYNITGSLIKTLSYGILEASKQNLKFSVSELTQGMYYLSIDTGYEITTKKIIVAK